MNLLYRGRHRPEVVRASSDRCVVTWYTKTGQDHSAPMTYVMASILYANVDHTLGCYAPRLLDERQWREGMAAEAVA